VAAKIGRQTKLTPQLQARIVQVLEAGNYIEAACDYVGINQDTYHEWVKRGKRGNKADREAGYSEFSEAVKRAQAQAEILSVARIRKAGQEGEWTADAWYLERSHPERWGRHVSKITHEIIDVRQLSDDELQAIIEDKSGGGT
jgi:predicted site-specific integrase-resolvase